METSKEDEYSRQISYFIILKNSAGPVRWLVDKSVCHQAWQLEFNPHTRHGGRRGWLLQAILWPPHMYTCMCACAHIHTPHIKCDKRIVFFNAVNLDRDSQLPRPNTKSRCFAVRSTTGSLRHSGTGTDLSKCVLCRSWNLARTPIAWNALKSSLATWRVSVFNKCGYHTMEFSETIWVCLKVFWAFSHLHWFLEGACKRNNVGPVLPISQVGM